MPVTDDASRAFRELNIELSRAFQNAPADAVHFDQSLYVGVLGHFYREIVGIRDALDRIASATEVRETSEPA